VECRLWAACKQTVAIIQTWQYQCTYQRIQCVIVNITAQARSWRIRRRWKKHVLAQWRALASMNKCWSMYTPMFLTTVDGWRRGRCPRWTLDRVRSAWLSLANCCRVPSQMTSDFAAFSLRRCQLQHRWISSTQSISACLAAWTSSVRADLLSWVSSAKLWNATPCLSATSCSSDAYVRYRSGPNVEPCGTLESRSMT